ncbi:MAG: 3-methyl-2-oxobutanoate hydroxymethyltransferase [Candidatus Hydrothermia bacterium]|jgi:3-methyl-2-oxobutanoate hydroxymethyltransferase|nr:3-methyl-2-oxobutanoate hydroxymethyltransferase [Candidatus Hydrothermia bacterium]
MKKLKIEDIINKKGKEKITSLTAYDYITAQILDNSGIDIILVGDSLSNVIQGNKTTIPVSMEEMIYHSKIVSKAVNRALVIGDMPFMSYQVSIEEGIRNAMRFLKEGSCDGVKIEGGYEILELVKKLVNYGVPVMGHIGLMPQRVNVYGYKLVKDEKLLDIARSLEDAGVFSIVLEKVSYNLAKKITETLKIPTIGIASGPYCDGQVLVFHDMIGLTEQKFKFVRLYLNARELFTNAVKKYIDDVKSGAFPSLEESYE